VYCSVVRLLFLRLVPLAELGELTTGDVPSLESLVLVERFFRRFALSRSGAGGERLTVERSLNGKLVSNICSSVTSTSITTIHWFSHSFVIHCVWSGVSFNRSITRE